MADSICRFLKAKSVDSDSDG
uniref:Uncharacterized protein n=1 Tax=Anguilla anguilla TaxID=7936 RepID=A0A0E9VZI9_ANGAN